MVKAGKRPVQIVAPLQAIIVPAALAHLAWPRLQSIALRTLSEGRLENSPKDLQTATSPQEALEYCGRDKGGDFIHESLCQQEDVSRVEEKHGILYAAGDRVARA